MDIELAAPGTVTASPLADPRTPRPLAGLRLALAGPGRVGQSLALWARDAGATLVKVAARRAPAGLDPAFAEALRADAAVWAPWSELESADCDLLLLAVADPAIAGCAAALAGRPQAPVVLHVSGSRGAEELSPLAGLAAPGALHPLRAFAGVLAAPEPGTFYALDGDGAAQALAERLVAAWSGVSGTIRGADRWLYHLAATLAAGGVTTLLTAVRELIAAADLPPALFGAYRKLLDSALTGLGDPQGTPTLGQARAAITGPAVRHDLPTLEAQRRALAKKAPALLPLVRALQDQAWRYGSTPDRE